MEQPARRSPKTGYMTPRVDRKLQKGDRAEIVLDDTHDPISVRVVAEETDGWISVTTELEYDYATMNGDEPEALIRVYRNQVRLRAPQS